MEDEVQSFYSELRKVREGKLAILLGAGASYDFGIPTMYEIAKMLVNRINSPGATNAFSSTVNAVLRAVAGIPEEACDGDNLKWNVEDLLTRLYYLEETLRDAGPFPKADAILSGRSLEREQVREAQDRLLAFIAECYDLNSDLQPDHGDSSVQYISRFLELIGEFQRRILVFTTNGDLCVEAAVTRLQHEQRTRSRKKFHLIDGFSTGLLPTFAVSNYEIDYVDKNCISVYLWKLHGSVDWTYSNPITNGDSSKCDSSDIASLGDQSIICKRSEHLWESLHNADAIGMKAPGETRIMIFPSPLKYSQSYTNPYMELYQMLRRTLEAVEVLLVVGTSFPDAHINSAIKSFLSRSDSLMYVVDPKDVVNILGNYPSIQPVIEMGFQEFTEQLLKIESGDVTQTRAVREGDEDGLSNRQGNTS